MITLGILVSGNGSNLQAIIDAIAAGNLDARIALVISNKPDVFALERAQKAGISTVVVEPSAYDDSSTFNTALAVALKDAGVEYVVMAGYMKLLGVEVLNAFPQRVLNLHPALLPSFPGAHGIEDALDAGVKVTGVTVHFANEIFDEGPILAQRAVDVYEDDTVDSLAERIHAVEHVLYPQALALIAQGRVSVEGRHVHIAPAAR